MTAPALAGLRGEIETPRPLRFPSGEFFLTGWCLDGARVPAVRLRAADAVFAATVRHARPEFAGVECGFTLSGCLPAGVHLAHLEGQLADGTWSRVRSFSLCIDPAALAADIDWPVSAGIVSDRVRLAGWAVHPTQEIAAVSLRFGHQEIACDYGAHRPDVAAQFSTAPHAARCGFITAQNLPAGHGPVRVKCTLRDGTVALAQTHLTVSIPEDENTPAALALTAPHLSLGAAARSLAPTPTAATDRPRNILFILPGSFAANNAVHAAALANELVATGHRCAIAVSSDLETIDQLTAPAFTPLTHADALDFRFADGRGPDILHAWTSREHVRQTTERLRAHHRSAVVVHLEDNEQQILALSLGRDFAELDRLPAAELDRLVPPDLSHPHRARAFLAAADGVTLITPKLRELAPPAARCLVFWPAADARYFFSRPQPGEFRRLLDPRPDPTVLFYHGNVHAANAAEMRELYLAVALLNDSGLPVTLIRTGRDVVDFLGADATRTREHVIELGLIPHHHHLPPLMALADIFVQPGAPDAFNDYRFPSKLPEFFSLGRPVVLPRTNLGESVRHGIDAYVLDRADAAGIARAVCELRADRALADRLAEGAGRFAAEHFSWPRSAQALAKFYASLATS